MRKYSPITKIKIQNFRNIGEAELDFTESPIISLIGENESGKTSVVKSIAVCAMHADPRYQKDYIRDGTNGFGVAIYLEDGTIVTRIKMKTLNRYQVIRPDGTEWSADKLESGVPVEVEKVMGMTEEPETKEFLHIRTYEDQLLFVVTPDSTNYKVMYHALKVEQLTKAIKTGSSEVNDLKGKIVGAETSIGTLNATLSGLRVVDIEPLVNIKNKVIELSTEISKIESVISLLDRVEVDRKKLGAIGLLEDTNTTPLSLVEVSILEQYSRLVEKMAELNRYSSVYNQLNTVENIDTTLVNKLKDTVDRCDNLSRLVAEAGALTHISEISPVNEMEVNALSKLNDLLDKVESQRVQLEIYDSHTLDPIGNNELNSLSKMEKVFSLQNQVDTEGAQLPSIDNYIDQVLQWMKQVGVSTTSCPKCGEAIVIDLDLLDKGAKS